MPSSLLFGVNNEGRVYTLSTGGSMWRELPYNGQEFKKLSGVPFFLWGLGGDHQLYVYVHGLDIPIRIREESYENERWLPIEGFSSRLLPTDRCHFSNADGTIDRPIDKIRLPSMAWQWEGDWQLELTLDGRPLDHNGWTYAVDFPAQFSAKKQWKSCVRRRLWTRTAKYCAMNSWCAIAPLHKDATKEPYIDVAVGGQNVPGTAPGTILVWAVTSHNRVMFRVGVSTKSPEGARWNQIQVPPGCEINQVSVGPCGLVWAALLDGRALVRLGVTRDTLQGESWLEVRSPVDGLRITQLSVGSASVWAVTNDKQIWFRQGVKGEGAGVSEEMAAGATWIEMVGRMLMVSVTSNDHVFAVGADDRLIYQRIGIGAADFTGKRWRALRAPLQVSRASSNASLGRDKFHRSLNHLGSRPSSMIEQSNLSEYEEQSRSAPLGPTSLPAGEPKFEIEPKHHKAWSPVRSVGSIVGTEAHPETDESVWNESSRGSCIFSEEDELGWAEFDAPWSWVEAGTCLVETAQPPNWFPDANCAALQEEFEQEWRNRILDDLKCRTPALNAFAQYEKAVETASWLHKAEARVNLGGGHFVDCILQLEWIQTAGTLTVLNADGATSMHSFPLSDVTCVQLSSEPGSPRLAVHTPRNSPAVVILQFPSDVLVEEWQTHFYATCGKLRDAKGKVSEESVWAVTNLGDVFVWDSAQLESAQLREDDCYVQKFDLSGKECPIKVALHVGCVPGTTLTLTGCVADDAERLGINLEAAPTYRNKHKTFAELENVCLHLNPRFGDATLVRNSMSDGKWHEEERDGGRMPFGRGREFKLTIDSTEDAFRIVVDDAEPITFRHRLPSQSACFLHLWGRMRPFKLVIRSPAIVVDPLELYWRPLGGHLRRVESCTVGVTWGIGYDHTAWVYTGGWGGGFLGPSDSQNVGPMTDSQDYRVYENQRWNPVSGYTSSGLPTDRHMWSDVTGKQKRLKEQVKLLSCRWQWVSDWMVDFHVPGGVDKEGWQYAVDFPATYHANKQFTDMVRRRRWYRRCAIATTGPWHELGHTKLLDVTLETVNDEPDSPIAVWALANGGQAMFRVGTSRTNPAGHVWEHVTTDQPLTSISCGPYDRVWATGKTGCAYLRAGVTADLLQGERWTCVAPPSGARLKQISSNGAGVWAADASGRLHVRVAMTSSVPEGADWQTIVADPPILNAARPTSGFKQVSVGKSDVWTITDGGAVARRLGISAANPAGSGWDIGIAAEKKGCTATEYGLVFGIFEFVVFVVSPLYGQHLNKIGPKVTFNGGIYTTGVCAILFGLLDKVEGHVPFIALSFAIRIVEAMGNAAFLTASFAIIAKEFPDKVATTFASLETFFGLGLIVGPTVGGALFELGGYTLPFAVMGSALFASAILTALVLPKHDLGTDKAKGPSIFKALKIPGVMVATGSIVVTSTSISFLQATLEPHLREFKLTAVVLGLMFVINGGVYAITTPLWGWLCDNTATPKVVTAAGTFLVAAGFCLIGPAPFIPLPTIFWMTITGLVLHGLGMGAQLVASFGDALKTVVLHGYPNDLETYALVSGLWTSSFAFGAFIGPSVAGILYDTVGFRNASMFIVVVHIVVGVATTAFLYATRPSSYYVELLDEPPKLPNGDLQEPPSVTQSNDNLKSFRSIGNGISIEKSRPPAMNSLIACNSYKTQAWPERDSINLAVSHFSHSYGAVNARTNPTTPYLDGVS